MDTRSSRTPATSPSAPSADAGDWRPAEGIIDRMLAYRDWWNMPTRRAQPRRSPKGAARPQSPDHA